MTSGDLGCVRGFVRSWLREWLRGVTDDVFVLAVNRNLVYHVFNSMKSIRWLTEEVEISTNDLLWRGCQIDLTSGHR